MYCTRCNHQVPRCECDDIEVRLAMAQLSHPDDTEEGGSEKRGGNFSPAGRALIDADPDEIGGRLG